MRCLLHSNSDRSVIYIRVCESTHPDCDVAVTHMDKPVHLKELEQRKGSIASTLTRPACVIQLKALSH